MKAFLPFTLVTFLSLVELVVLAQEHVLTVMGMAGDGTGLNLAKLAITKLPVLHQVVQTTQLEIVLMAMGMAGDGTGLNLAKLIIIKLLVLHQVVQTTQQEIV